MAPGTRATKEERNERACGYSSPAALAGQWALASLGAVLAYGCGARNRKGI